ncbi:flagellar hook-associated protein FlgK [Pararhizobium gei]|uniref:flagellar hook-associated protein FlgK n=1 Tax=Pararhizobium gei TaxID=1395951 RepID=UPI0023DA5937|nr:flagellar hook-associated protein FlgK [Rhizobium gei]
MSLASAINTAQTIFSNTAAQTSVVAKNIANSGNADYVRRLAMMGVDSQGSHYIKIQRAQNDALFKENIVSISGAAAQSRLLDSLESMKSVYGGNDYPSSPSKYLASFRTALQTFAAAPGNITVASSAISDAKDLANSLNTASAAIQEARADTDDEISEQVGKLNSYLTEFATVNNAIVGALALGKDASDVLDQRDGLLKKMAEIIGISAVTRQNLDTVIYTSDGTVLFETVPRIVEFTRIDTYGATVEKGNAIKVDGVALKAGSGGNTTADGTLSSLLQFRDDVAPTMQAQLDEIARGLIRIFAETDPDPLTPPALPDAVGLFTWETDTIPDDKLMLGLAASIKVNPKVDANPKLLRDGGINGVGYIANVVVPPATDAPAAFTKLLDKYIVQMDTAISFDTVGTPAGTSTKLSGSNSIMSFASSSIGWLEQLRKAATTSNDNKVAMLSKTQQALSNETGVSLDEELALMLDLEQSYKASAKLLSTVDEMLRTLLDTVR